MVVILVVLILAAVGLGRLGRNLEPRQRVVMVLTFLFGVVWLIMKLMQAGLLGRATTNR